METNEKRSMHTHKPPNLSLYEAIGDILISCAQYGCATPESLS